MTDQLMYDAVTVDNIPREATMVAGYVDGGYRNWQALVVLFPHARKVSITVTGDVVADVIDIENGDASPQKAVAWVRAMRTQGRRPVVYTSTANWPNVLTAFQNEREAPPFWWAADWTGEPHLKVGSVATQYASPQVPPPGRQIGYDVSLVSPNWPPPTERKPKVRSLPLPSWSTFYRAVALVGSALGLVVSIGNQLHLPNSVRVVISGVAGGILWIEHHKVTAGTPQKPPTPPAGG